MVQHEPGGPQIRQRLIDQLDGKLPEWFTDEDWAQIAKEFQEDLEHNPTKYNALTVEYDRRLGLTFTNNMYMWFLSKSPITTYASDAQKQLASRYDLDTSVLRNQPAVMKLRAIQQEYPELFSEVQHISEASMAYNEPLFTKISEGRAIEKEEAIYSNVLQYKKRASLEKVLKILREVGITEEEIEDLCQ